jgi:RNA-directed DNA polymerase
MSRTVRDLAQLLAIPLSDLERISREPKSQHYRYERRLIGKKLRLLRVPLGRFRKILDTIKTQILDPMPLPSTMHGWRKRRSPKSYAMVHLRHSSLINVDIQDFFPSVNGARVYDFWMRAGFTSEAAKLLTALTVCDNQLPQGSPTSQAIGNQVLVHLDRRLNRLSKLNDVSFSMLGDEFTLSGRRRVKRLKGLTIRIVEQEGFKVNPTKVKDPDRWKTQEIGGIVVNKKPSLGRDHYRMLRAIIYNCAKYGPESQNQAQHPNFMSHIRGHISHMKQINPKLGSRLLEYFNKINWN